MTTPTLPLFVEARARFHAALLDTALKTSDAGIPSNADKDSKHSVLFAKGILTLLGSETTGLRLSGQTSGKHLETITKNFLAETFTGLGDLRPGIWDIRCVGGRNSIAIAHFEQYAHLIALQDAAKKDRALAAALQSDYTITPDIIIAREPEEDAVINAGRLLVGDTVAKRSVLRKAYSPTAILHASISCKWTLRSDRAQNARSEALNLIRNRKGRLPHIAVVTGEPLPSRIASLALGTGDIDCVYHFALDELLETVAASGYDDARELLDIMVDGKRLKDISDLPLDLAVLAGPVNIMADHLTPEARSQHMARVKGRDTKPEIIVRRLLHGLGYRFRLHRRDLLGRPDIVLPKHWKIIFVHGCFWHSHSGCRRSARPSTNREFWDKKIDGNIARDTRDMTALDQAGWGVLVVWECQTRNTEALRDLLTAFMAAS